MHERRIPVLVDLPMPSIAAADVVMVPNLENSVVVGDSVVDTHIHTRRTHWKIWNSRIHSLSTPKRRMVCAVAVVTAAVVAGLKKGWSRDHLRRDVPSFVASSESATVTAAVAESYFGIYDPSTADVVVVVRVIMVMVVFLY